MSAHRFNPATEYDEKDGFPYPVMIQSPEGMYVANAELERATVIIADLRAKLDAAEKERDLAIAHDQQPYPTAWAYEQACKALEVQRTRADRLAEALHALVAAGDEQHPQAWCDAMSIARAALADSDAKGKA